MTEASVRTLLAQYLSGKVELRDLDEQIVMVAWDMNVEAEVRALANEITLRVDEFSSRSCSESELRAALLPHVTQYTVSVGPTATVGLRSGADSIVSTQTFTARQTFFGREVVTAS